MLGQHSWPACWPNKLAANKSIFAAMVLRFYHFLVHSSSDFILDEIKMLERNRQKREDEGSRPIYLVIKEEEKPQLGPGHPVRTDYAPKVIWVHNFGDIREWIENILLKRQRKPQIRVSLVNDASDYQSNESAFNLEEMKQKNYDCNAINCVVVTFY